jgi:hypothetical protein
LLAAFIGLIYHMFSRVDFDGRRQIVHNGARQAASPRAMETLKSGFGQGYTIP